MPGPENPLWKVREPFPGLDDPLTALYLVRYWRQRFLAANYLVSADPQKMKILKENVITPFEFLA